MGASRASRRLAQGGRRMRSRRVVVASRTGLAEQARQWRPTSSSIWGRLRVAPSRAALRMVLNTAGLGRAKGARPAPEASVEKDGRTSIAITSSRGSPSKFSPDMEMIEEEPDIGLVADSMHDQLDFVVDSVDRVMGGQMVDTKIGSLSEGGFSLGSEGAASGWSRLGGEGSLDFAAGDSEDFCMEEEEATGGERAKEARRSQGRRPGSDEAHARYLQHLVRGYRRLRGVGWAAPGGLASCPAPIRPVTSFRCRGGRCGALEQDFIDQRQRGRKVCDWYGVYVDIYRRLSNKGAPQIVSPFLRSWRRRRGSEAPSRGTVRVRHRGPASVLGMVR